MNIQLQTILDPDKEICDIEALYFHRNGQELCYDGYFNLFYIEKWKRYTTLEQLKLKIRLKGYQTLRLYHNRDCIQEISLETDIFEEHLLYFPWNQYDEGVFWFSLIQPLKSNDCFKEGFFVGECPNAQKVKIAIDICTYKREAYVLRNLKVLCEKVLKNMNLQVSEALWVYIIDNGKTLNENEPIQNYLETNATHISVIPNPNVGGAGGFTRGMIEVLNQKETSHFTHILLMDDDAILNPDLFVRIYGFLRSIKAEWRDITVGGTMLREDLPYMLYASGEEWTPYDIFNPNKNLDLRENEHACCESLLTTRFEKTQYSAWWCCCYSLNVIREDNLPIPLFIHHDDIEFGLRNRNSGVVFLNGVNVWHRSFDGIPPGSNLYYDFRNNMIEITQQCDLSAASKHIWHFYWKRLAARLVKGSYADIYWTIRSASDFLKGPMWLWEQNPLQLHEQIKNPAYSGYIRLLYESVKICLMLLCQKKRVIADYQKNMHKYTTKQAWIKYLEPGRNTSL